MRTDNPTTRAVKALIERRGWTNEQAAEYLGVSPHTVIKWFNGQRQPGSIVARLLEVLGLIEALAPAIHEEIVRKGLDEGHEQAHE